MRRFSLVGTLLVIISLVVGLSWLGLKLIGRSFVADGEHSDEIENLGADATIIRDGYGIPYITAASENDAYTALGYAHAQDRLWQMDLMRRAGEGRLSEIFGPETVSFDIFLRTVGYKRVSDEILTTMPKRTRASIDAYCRGINAFIESHQGRLPMEFDALGYVPEPWKPEHSVIISRLLAWELNTSFWTDIVLGDLRNTLDSAKFNEILPYYPSDGPTILPGGQHPEALLENIFAPPPPPPDTTRRDSTDTLLIPTPRPARRDSSAPRPRRAQSTRAREGAYLGAPSGEHRIVRTPDLSSLIDMEQRLRVFLHMDGAHLGSNAWVISGKRAKGGRPMLANDPHLTHTAPSRWYQTVMNYSGNRVGGVTIPGSPFIVIGRNNDVSWGLTSMMADETDFFIEQLDSLGKNTMLHDGKYEKLRLLRDTVKVKDSAWVPMVIRIGKHGPLISDVDPYLLREKPQSGQKKSPGGSPLLATSPVAMRWRGSDPSQELAAWQGMNNAHSLPEFTSAARLGGVPALSILYADAKGTIAYVPVARIPLREGTLANLPNPGWDSRYNWKGTIPMEKLPTFSNPESGYISSANNKVANDLPFSLGDQWEDPSRAARLVELLSEGNNFEITDFAQMQGDIISPHMRLMTQFLLHAFPDSLKQGTAVQEALARLRGWDAGMREDSPEAAIIAVWLQTAFEMTYRDEMGPTLFKHWVMMAQMPLKALRRHAMTDSRWFDDVSTSNRVETRDDILRIALGEALKSLQKRFDTWDIGKWRYGAFHTLVFPHPFNKNETLKEIVNIGPFELGGSNTTLNNGDWDLNEPYNVRIGPSMRQIVDFADTTAFLQSVITSGASGQPLNQFYKNQTVLWLSNGYLSLRSSPPTGAEITSIVRLTPKR